MGLSNLIPDGFSISLPTKAKKFLLLNISEKSIFQIFCYKNLRFLLQFDKVLALNVAIANSSLKHKHKVQVKK